MVRIVKSPINIKTNCDKMKILFIGARLFEDVAPYTKNLAINSILTESNPESPNLKLADSYHIVSRGMDEPMQIAINEEVDGVVPLIGIDEPLVEIAIMKERLEAGLWNTCNRIWYFSCVYMC